MYTNYKEAAVLTAEQTLGEIFPEFHPEVISQVLASVHHSVKDAHDILLSMSDPDRSVPFSSETYQQPMGAAHANDDLRSQILDHVMTRRDAKMCKRACKQERREQKHAGKELRRSIRRARTTCCFSSMVCSSAVQAPPQSMNAYYHIQHQRHPGLVGSLVGLGIAATKKAISATTTAVGDKRETYEPPREMSSTAVVPDIDDSLPPPYDFVDQHFSRSPSAPKKPSIPQ